MEQPALDPAPTPDTAARLAEGHARLRDQQPRAAVDAFRAALALAPEDVEARAGLGTALLAAGQAREAEAHLREVLATRPRHAVAVRNLGVLLMEGGRHDEALATADAVLGGEPDHRQALLLRGAALAAMSQFSSAVATYRHALAAWPEDAETLTQLGLAHAARQEYDAALTALDRAVALRPDDPFPRSRRGTLRLQLRDFGGWTDYEARLDLRRFLARSGGILNPTIAADLVRSPTAAVIAGRRVLLLGEQGIGDQLMFASMIPDLRRAAGAVTCVCDARLARLFSASFEGVQVFGPKTARVARAEIDSVLAMGSLGEMFRSREADFPGAPFLAPGAQVRDGWAKRLGPRRGRLRIGLSWRGGLPSTRRNERSLSLDQLRPLLDLPGCEFVSLQYGDVADETAGWPLQVFPGADIDDFEDLAGLVANLDLVVSVQTALVHLAGAMGAPCLTLVPHNPEWRYTARGETMPWYGSVRLFRQDAPGAWAPVIQQVAQEVRARLSGAQITEA